MTAKFTPEQIKEIEAEIKKVTDAVWMQATSREWGTSAEMKKADKAAEKAKKDLVNFITKTTKPAGR